MQAFLKDENGAVTVEWVVLTAASVGMGLAVMSVVSAGVQDAATDIESFLTNIPIMTSFDQWDTYRAAHGGGQVAAQDQGFTGYQNGCHLVNGEIQSCD